MNVTLTLDDDLVKKVRKIAVDRDTTLTAMVREYLKQVADGESEEERRKRAVDAFEESVRVLSRPLNHGQRTWRREDLYDRRG